MKRNHDEDPQGQEPSSKKAKTNSEEPSDSESSSEDYEVNFTGTLDAHGKYSGKGMNLLFLSNFSGTLEFKSGTKYVGSFTAGKLNGEGQIIFPDGSCLSGENFVDNCLSGDGTFLLEEGTKMVGRFVDNLLCGQGKEFYPDGTLFFEGEYLDGIRHGKGIMYFTDEATEIQGVWEDGVLQG